MASLITSMPGVLYKLHKNLENISQSRPRSHFVPRVRLRHQEVQHCWMLHSLWAGSTPGAWAHNTGGRFEDLMGSHIPQTFEWVRYKICSIPLPASFFLNLIVSGSSLFDLKLNSMVLEFFQVGLGRTGQSSISAQINENSSKAPES